jgi:hypothetical protein
MQRTGRKDFEIMAMAGVFQLVLLAAFLAGWVMWADMKPAPPPRHAEVMRPQAETRPPAPAPIRKVDFDAGMTSSQVVKTAPPPQEAPVEDADAELTTGTLAPEEPVDVTGPEGQGEAAMGALITMDQRGKLRIGNYESMTLDGTAEQCLDMGRMLLTDAGASAERLEVMARTKAITMARICAANGSVVITCRRNQITISPRQLKPNESCES